MPTDAAGDNEEAPASSQSQSDSSSQAPAGGGLSGVVSFISNNKLDACLWLSRITTVVCSIMYLIPLYGPEAAVGFYHRAMICNGLTSALRLHQRLPPFQLSRVFLSLLMVEDSCHNLFYSLIFANGYPISLAVTPPFLFALLHASSFSRKIINEIGPNSLALFRRLLEKIINIQSQILRFIALNEIMIMPFIIFMVFTGKVSFIVPLMYFRFVTFRYASRRNPYCKQIFHEMRIVIEGYCQKPNTPEFLRNFLTKCIGMLSRFAPPMQQ